MAQIQKYILILIGILFPLMVMGQSSNDYTIPGPIYVDADGKIYVKSGADLYLRLATSPDDDADSWVIRNQASKDMAEPFHLEGHGRHTVRHEADHRIPQKNKDRHLFYINDDGKSPLSKVTVTKAPWVYNGNTNIYGKPVDISIAFSDADSGVFSGYYALNSDLFVPYSSSITLQEEMDFTLLYYAMDNVGNKSKVRTRYYSLDFTPPLTLHKVVGNETMTDNTVVVSPRTRIELISMDEKAGVRQIRYRFKGKRGVYSKPLDMAGLEDGMQQIIYAAEDRVKNAEKNNTFSFYLDTIPPAISDDIIGDQYMSGDTTYVSGRTQVEMYASDYKAGVRRIRYSINESATMTFEEPFFFPQKNGKAVYEYRASDLVRNVSQKNTRTVIVDISAPDVKPTFNGEYYFSRDIHYIRKTTEISLATSDNLSGVKSFTYQVDMQPARSDGKPFTIDVEGEHTVEFSAVDNVNNQAEDSLMVLYVDEISPDIYHHFSVNETFTGLKIYPPKTLLYLAATDKQAGIREIFYSIEGGKEQMYDVPLSFEDKGYYTVTVRAVDNVGNIAISEIDFKIQ